MTAERLNDWKVTVLDHTGHEIGTVSISRTENRQFTRKRLWGLINDLNGVADQAIEEYASLELLNKREARYSGYDQTIMQSFRSAFPFDDVDKLFYRHNPSESINGQSYYLVLLEAILRGFETATDCGVSQTWVTIDTRRKDGNSP